MVGARSVFIEQNPYTIEAIPIFFVSFSHHMQLSYMPPNELMRCRNRCGLSRSVGPITRLHSSIRAHSGFSPQSTYHIGQAGLVETQVEPADLANRSEHSSNFEAGPKDGRKPGGGAKCDAQMSGRGVGDGGN